MVHAEREAGLWMNNVWVRKAVCGNKRKQRGSWGKKMKECGPFFKTPRIFSDPFFRLCLLTFWEPATGFFSGSLFFYTICSGKTKIFGGWGEISIQPCASEEKHLRKIGEGSQNVKHIESYSFKKNPVSWWGLSWDVTNSWACGNVYSTYSSPVISFHNFPQYARADFPRVRYTSTFHHFWYFVEG